MDSETLRKVQNVQLEIAAEIKRICDKHDINYFLDSGTLIGAVRHKGFIPWDDDMDIGMLRKDYDKFISVAESELGEGYFLHSWDTDDGYPLPFIKIRKNGTVYEEAASENKYRHNGIFVDILPYDEMPSQPSEQKKMKSDIFFWCRVFYCKDGLKPWKHHSRRLYRFLSMCRYMPYAAASHFIKKDKIKSKCIEVMRRYNGQNTGFVFKEWGDLAGCAYVPSECFSEFTEVPFESESFKIPAGYDAILTRQYGDYMQLPPESERENRHQVLKVKF